MYTATEVLMRIEEWEKVKMPLMIAAMKRMQVELMKPLVDKYLELIKETKIMAEHSKYAPSASSRWLACHGSIHMSGGIKDSTSPYAHEGIVCHDVAARCLKENIAAHDFTGEVIEKVVMTKELLDGIQLYVDEVRGMAKELGVKGGRIEHTVQIAEDCWGTIDATMWNAEVAIVNDLKMGKGVIVEVVDNTQLMLYTIGQLMWLLKEHGLKPEKVILIITQPRTVNPIRKWETTREYLIKWYKETLKPALEKIKSGDTECIPGEVQCRWCPASAVCTAQAEYIMRSTKEAFAPFSTTTAPTVDPEDPTIDIAKQSELKKVFKQVQSWMGAIEENLMALALTGEDIPGFKLVRGRANRAWSVDDKILVDFGKAHGITVWKEPVLNSPAGIEKLMGKKKAETAGLKKYITTPLGNPTLVVESDKRPVMETNVEKNFEEFADAPDLATLAAVVNDAPMEGTILVETKKTGMTLLERLARADIEDDPQVPDPMEGTPETVAEDAAQERLDNISDLSDFVDGMGERKAEPQIETKEDMAEEIATSGTPEVMQSANPLPTRGIPPGGKTKRYQVYNMGKGGVSLEDAAKALGCGVNSVKMHIRYLHERDGFGYEIYSDGTFKIIE